MDCRGFENAEAMNEYMIAKWNSRVRENDEVVILGDFSISPNGSEVNRILERLRGKKYLIRGNHDRYLESRKFDCSLFGWIEDYKELRDNKRKVVLSHYPIMCYNGQYRVHDSGEVVTYMLYGHVHNTFDEWLINEYQNRVQASKTVTRDSSEAVSIPCRMINCFCMFSDYVPLTLDEWIKVDEARRSVLNADR